MKKRVILWVLVLSVIMSSQVSAQFSSDTVPLYDSEEEVTFIVEMEGEPVLPAIKLSQENKSAVENKNAQTYRNTLLKSHKAATDAIGAKLSEDIKPQYTYTELFNGFAIKAKYKDLETIRGAEGVKNVYISQKRKADFRMTNAPSMTHSLPAETMGYTGSGQVIAVLDNEFDVKHDAFSTDPQNPKYTKTDIESILSRTEFNASGNVNRVYESEKIPFRFDYGEGDADTYATVDVHGTHVAGIAAGNSPDGKFRGVAPDAQLVLMKISNAEGYLLDAAIAAALDDAAKLGVNVINCSFGFTYNSIANENPVIAICHENAYKAGIYVSVAAGNEGRGFYNMPTETIHIDDSATGTANALDNVFSVGSVENTVVFFDISEITLSDGSVIDSAPMYEGTDSIQAGEYVYCGLGYPEDFEGLDVDGKIAVIDRGEINFTDKANHAKAQGATGIIFINNEDDYIYSVELSLPAVCVAFSDGAILQNAVDKRISHIAPLVKKGFARELSVSDFSSYGTTEYLGLKPDISAPGGNIYSSLPDDEYGYQNGTSMAAPHISGVAAIINQYLADTGCTATADERVELIGNMMMSSADVVYMASDDAQNKTPFSPRVQGAGMVNTANAIKTPVILYADSGKSKIELGDQLTDTIEFSFTAQNLTENDVVYDKMSVVTLTDGYVTKEDGKNYISGTRLLKSELITDFDTITVPANASVRVSVQIKLDGDELEENFRIFQNGFHIDGFIRLENTTEDVVSVGMPFMGFYGDWTQAPIFDTTLYDAGGSKLIYEPRELYGTFLYTNHGENEIILGHNGRSDTYNADAIAISPDGNGYMDILGLQFATMRSVKDCKIIVADESGKVLSMTKIDVVSKFFKKKGNFNLPEDIADGKYFVRLEGYMNYDTENPTKQSVSMPFKVDRQKPIVKACKLEDNVLCVDVYDGSGLYYVSFTDSVTGDTYEMYYESYVEEDKIIFDFADNKLRDLSNIRIDIVDNAMNGFSYHLGGIGGVIDAQVSAITSNEEAYSITFALDGEDTFSNATLMLAFYDESGTLMHTDVLRDQTVASGTCVFTGDFDASTADTFKLFIWNGAERFKPLDTVKAFDMAMYVME